MRVHRDGHRKTTRHKLSTVAPVPEAAKAALKPGDEFEWGFYPQKGAPRIAKCKLVADPPALEEMDRDLAEKDPSVRGLFRAAGLLKEGLFLAAYREAARLAEAGKADEQVLAVMRYALEGMKLEDTPLWEDLIERVDRVGG